jgi:hypothetical protein
MPNKIYTNFPIERKSDSANLTKQFFDEYFDKPIQIDNDALILFKAHFEKRGFDKSSAEIISAVINVQAKQDGLNPMTILDTLSGLDNVEVNGLITQILNYHRFKSSAIGIYVAPTSSDEAHRNILP